MALRGVVRRWVWGILTSSIGGMGDFDKLNQRGGAVLSLAVFRVQSAG
jgi:hypothetical protein